jgi:membrane fusion protein (multidrug efflux system)
VPVEVSDVYPQTVREQFRALGSIDAYESVQIVSEVNALVVRLPFVEGRPIAAGALIAQLDDRAAAAEAARTEAQQTLARSNAERAEKLFAGGSISQSNLDDAHAALKVAEANAAAARVQLDKTHVRAPFSGVVGRRRISPGAYVKAGDVITELARIDVMKIRFSAPERELEHLGRGRQVEVTTPAVPGEVFTGEITVVDPIIDPQTRTVQIVARVGNSRRLLQAGMSGNVAVTLSERPQALTVPDEAVFAEGSQSFVFVVGADSTVQRAAIQLGIRDSARVEVVQGLEAGARVVRTGHQKLFPGAHVMPIPEGGMSPGGPAAAAGGAKPASASGAGAPVTKSTAKRGAAGGAAAGSGTR